MWTKHYILFFSLLDRKGLLYYCFFSLFCLFPPSVLTLYSASFNPCSLLSLYSTSFHPFSLPILTRHSTCFLSLFCFVPPVPPVLPRSTHLFSIFCLFPLFSLTIQPLPPFYAPFWASFYRFPLHIFSATPLPDFTPLFSFFCISFTSFPILFAWNFTRNGFFHFFTISLFLFSLPYSASLVFPLLFVPFYLLGSLPETVFFTFLHSYVCTCLEFYHGLTHPVLFLYFFSFPLLGTLSETFFSTFQLHCYIRTCLEFYQKLFFFHIFIHVSSYLTSWLHMYSSYIATYVQ